MQHGKAELWLSGRASAWHAEVALVVGRLAGRAGVGSQAPALVIIES